jgi:transcription elongation factor Elf1
MEQTQRKYYLCPRCQSPNVNLHTYADTENNLRPADSFAFWSCKSCYIQMSARMPKEVDAETHSRMRKIFYPSKSILQ